MVMNNIVILLVTGLLLTGCTFFQLDNNTTTTQEVPAGNQNVEEMVVEESDGMMEPEGQMMGEDGVVEFSMDLASFSFTPNVLNVKAGDKVRINLKNVGGFHDFVLDELSVASDQIQEGEETVVEFEVPTSAAGQSYEFYCSVGSHRAQGMVGTLIVE